MKNQTKTITLKAPPDKVYRFLSQVENLPKWATVYCQEVKKDKDGYTVVGKDGEMRFRIDGDPEKGILDMYAGPSLDQLMCWPGRVVPTGDGASVFMFTAFQAPGVTEEVFAEQCKALDEEFENIRWNVE